MTPHTTTFPCSLGDRVYSNRLRRAGTIVALSISEGSEPRARIEYFNRDDAPQLAWVLISGLTDPSRPVPSGHPEPNHREAAP
ncbi:hypothetical protein [uncultured Cohaesibacter sp.]|uniref:hypothetical protein n=1 Tax=uncultured Cohaesibacter sp. TaxID=1002546 RepID=UPI0029C8E3AF|nr:hypothetical protein [uncultured Cohaesibacter sp.]